MTQERALELPAPPPAPPAENYERQPENGLGLAAMIVGIASFFVLAPLSSTGAIILGVIGLRNPERARRRTAAKR